MKPISRRSALTLGGLGLAGTVVGGAGLLWWSSGALTQPPVGDEFAEPALLRSAQGKLQVHLTAASGPVTIGGRSATALSYNGSIPGPTLHLNAGDLLAVSLVNGLGAATNLHTHGLQVSPEGNADNPFVMVAPGGSFDYTIQLPASHPPGLFWYHPHHHGAVADQVFGGLYGAIIVDDPEPLEVSRERVLVISDITLDSLGGIAAVSPMDRMLGREGELVLVNGQLNPRLNARPGERERWRVVNACVSRYLPLRLDGQSLHLRGMDSARFPTPEAVDEVLLAPGNRADLLVTMAAGTAVLQAVAYDRGGVSGMMGGLSLPSLTAGNRTSLATLSVAGSAAASTPDVTAVAAPRDLRDESVSAERELIFAMGEGGGMGSGSGMMMSFTINGQAFDAQRVDAAVSAGNIEEWTLRNTSPMDHPVHLHVWPMQVIEVNGTAMTSVIQQDVVNVPANGQVTVRIAFEGITGRTVYHCHILDHEDLGMMGVIEVS